MPPVRRYAQSKVCKVIPLSNSSEDDLMNEGYLKGVDVGYGYSDRISTATRGVAVKVLPSK